MRNSQHSEKRLPSKMNQINSNGYNRRTIKVPVLDTAQLFQS